MGAIAKKVHDQLIANGAMPPNEDLHWCFAMNGEDFVRVEIGNEGTSQTGLQFDGRAGVAVGEMIAREPQRAHGDRCGMRKSNCAKLAVPVQQDCCDGQSRSGALLGQQQTKTLPDCLPCPSPCSGL